MEFAGYEHWVGFPCSCAYMATPWPSFLSVDPHPFIFPLKSEVDQKLHQFLFFLLCDTTCVFGNTEANNTINGEFANLLCFLMGHGYTVLQCTGSGKDQFAKMKMVLSHMQFILDIMDLLAHTEDTLWTDVNGDMAPCGHCHRV